MFHLLPIPFRGDRTSSSFVPVTRVFVMLRSTTMTVALRWDNLENVGFLKLDFLNYKIKLKLIYLDCLIAFRAPSSMRQYVIVMRGRFAA